MHLDALFEDDTIDIARLGAVLDGLGHAGRVESMNRWSAKTQARLFEAAKGHKSLSLEDFVPTAVEPLAEVIHWGKNSLPVFTLFQKRFCKPAPDHGAAKSELWGYNEGHPDLLFQVSPFTGPGYFVVHAPERDNAAGEIDIDYRMIPGGKSSAWPAIVPNEARLGRFVYAGMVDVMRGISEHVSIGRAIRGGKWADAWFVLCREDRAPT